MMTDEEIEEAVKTYADRLRRARERAELHQAMHRAHLERLQLTLTDDTSIEELCDALSIRPSNCLKNLKHGYGVNTVGQLKQFPDKDLLRIPNFGKKSLRELRGVLREAK